MLPQFDIFRRQPRSSTDLVRRNGQVLQAVAFTAIHGQLIYITHKTFPCRQRVG
jgi:hypothetical protein